MLSKKKMIKFLMELEKKKNIIGNIIHEINRNKKFF